MKQMVCVNAKKFPGVRRLARSPAIHILISLLHCSRNSAYLPPPRPPVLPLQSHRSHITIPAPPHASIGSTMIPCRIAFPHSALIPLRIPASSVSPHHFLESHFCLPHIPCHLPRIIAYHGPIPMPAILPHCPHLSPALLAPFKSRVATTRSTIPHPGSLPLALSPPHTIDLCVVIPFCPYLVY